MASKSVPAGSRVAVATTTIESPFPFAGDLIRDVGCELRSGNDVIGATRDRRVIPDGDQVIRSLTLNGGAQVPAGGGTISLWCFAQAGGDVVDNAQVMLLQVGGFS